MAYSVTFTLNALYTGTTQADNFTIIGKHSNGLPSDTTIATNVTKAQLTAGVTYQVADTITGGTVTSTGDCVNSVSWTGLSDLGGDPTQNFIFNRCTVDNEAPESVIITESAWNTINNNVSLPAPNDTIRVDGGGLFLDSVVFTFDRVSAASATHVPISTGDSCPGDFV